MKILKYSLFCLLLLAGFSSCKKDGFQPMDDSRPPIPVNVANAAAWRGSWAVSASEAANNFSIVLEIPESSGRKIKEITKVTMNSGPYDLLDASIDPFKPVPIPGNNTNKITFNTSISEIGTYGVPKPAYPKGIPAAEYPYQFYFLLTLDDNSTLITQPVRVLMVP